MAGLPGWTGSGTISTPLTFTGYFLPLPARHSKGEVTSRAFHTPCENRRLSRAQTERGVPFRGRDTHCSSRRRWRPRRPGGGGGRRRRRRGRGGSACSPWRTRGLSLPWLRAVGGLVCEGEGFAGWDLYKKGRVGEVGEYRSRSCEFDFFNEFLLQVSSAPSFDFGDLDEDWSVAGTLTCGAGYKLMRFSVNTEKCFGG